MHPLRKSLAHQRSVAALPPKEKRIAARRTFPALLFLGLFLALSVVGLLTGYQLTHRGGLPRDHRDVLAWLQGYR